MNEIQFGKCCHALGIGDENGAYRNYYNSGYEPDKDLDELVERKLVHKSDRGKEMGGIFYTLSEKGIEFMSTALRRNIKEELNRYS